jgi:hypothetical protein
MRFCNSICTHFLNQIKKNSGPQGGTWQYTDKIDMDPRVYNFRVIPAIHGSRSKYVNVIEDYRKCSQCGIQYNKYSFGGGLKYCICCSTQLTLRHYKVSH